MSGISPERSGGIGWLGIATGVVAWDIMAPESLTHAFHRGMENPRTRPLVLGALAITAAHLLEVIPRQYDPFYIFIDKARRSSDV